MGGNLNIKTQWREPQKGGANFEISGGGGKMGVGGKREVDTIFEGKNLGGNYDLVPILNDVLFCSYFVAS